MFRVAKKIFKKFGEHLRKDIEGLKAAKEGLKHTPVRTEMTPEEVGAIKKVVKYGDDEITKAWSLLEQRVAKRADERTMKNHKVIIETLEKGNKVPDIKRHLGADDIKRLETEGAGFVGNYKEFRSAMTNKAIDDYTMTERNRLSKDVLGLYGGKYHELVEPELKRIKAKTISSRVKQEADVLHKYYVAANNLKTEGVALKPTLWKKIKEEIFGMEAKANSLYSFARGRNWENLSKQAVNFQKGREASAVMGTRMKLMTEGINSELRSYGDDGMRKIEQYINTANFTLREPKIIVGGTMGSKQMRNIDRKTMEALEMTEDMVRTANKNVQKNRYALKMRQEVESRNFNAEKIPHGYKELDGDYIPEELFLPISTGGRIGDLGVNYTPLVPTDEYRAALKTKKGLFQQKESVNYGGMPDKRRRLDSELSKNPDLRKNMADANEDYMGDFLHKITRKTQEEQLFEMGHTMSVYGTMTTAEGKAALTRDDLVASMKRSNDFLAPMFKELEREHVAKASNPDNILSKAFFSWLNLEKTAAISGAPLALLNTLQPITTVINVPMHKILKEYLVQAPALTVDTIVGMLSRNKSGFFKPENVLKRKLNRLDPDSLRGKTIYKYFAEHSDLNLSTAKEGIEASDLFGQHLGKRFGGFVNDALTYMFRTSDMHARSLLLDASAAHYESALKKFGHLKGKDQLQFLSKMKKELNLDTFFGKDMQLEQIMNLLPAKDPSRAAYAYAKLTVNQALFDYRPHSRPNFVKLGRKNDLLKAATVFTSWPLYYAQVARSYAGAAASGNYKPLANLAATAVVWGGVMSALSESDNEFVSKFGTKGVGRTPGMASFLMPASLVTRDAGGIMSGTIQNISYMPAKIMSISNNWITKNKDSFDRLVRETEKGKSASRRTIENIVETINLD